MLSDLVVASGTVFNQILLWNLQELSTLRHTCSSDVAFWMKTRLTLVGHEVGTVLDALWAMRWVQY